MATSTELTLQIYGPSAGRFDAWLDRISAMRDGRTRDGVYERIYAVVEAIPAGRVATYGQVAALAGISGHARQVGYALHAAPESSTVPWQRVINARGEVSPRSAADRDWVPGYQRHLLEEEGVEFDDRDRVDLKRFRWKP